MNAEAGLVSGVSVAHRRADMSQLEAASVESQREAVDALLSNRGVTEAYVLQTCNRIEAYVVTEGREAGRAALDSFLTDVPDDVVRSMGHEESLRHLLRVAAGLESLVLGEDQILGQVRDAYEDARTADGIGPLLENGVTKAIRVGERARTETAINEGVVSLASAAVRLAREKHGIDGSTGLVVGAGEMGTVAAKRLGRAVDRLVIANRTVERAVSVAETVDDSVTVDTVSLDDVATAVDEATVVISATGATDNVFDPSAFADAGDTFVVDIARPRDVPPAVDDWSHLTVYDLDRLEAVTEKTWQMRQRAAERVEHIVDEEFERLLVQYKRERADQVISAMYEGAERIKARELETAFSKLDLDEEEEKVVESMADTLVSQLLAAPTDSLRDAAEDDDWSTIHTALQLFDPSADQSDTGSVFVDQPVSPEELPDHVREQMPASVLEQLQE